jgi:hypothetical protein
MAFTSPSLGIEFALYYPDPSKPTSGTVTTYLGLSKATFSDPISQPIPVWTASAGNDITIGLWRAARPQVVRFTYYASQNGSALDLPSANGHTGPVSAWVGPAAVYVTYVDQVSSSGPVPTMQRFFLRIESPITLP